MSTLVKNNKEKWCYTVELPLDQKVPEDDGTHVWGWVQAGTNSNVGKQIIKVFSATSSWGEASDGVLSVKFLGDMDITEPQIVQDHGFNRGEITEVEKTMDLAGNLIILYVMQEGTKPQLCNKIQVSMSYRIWHFPCSNLLMPGGTQSWPASGNVGQNVTFNVKQGCKDPVWITIQGNQGTTIKQILSDHGMTPGPYVVDILGDFVGDMFKVRADKLPGCQLIVNKVIVKQVAMDGEFESGYEKPVEVYQEWVIPKKPKDEPAKPPMKGAIVPPPKEPTPMEQLEIALGQVNEAGITFNGKCLPKEEFEQAEKNQLSCDSKFEDVIGNQSLDPNMQPTVFPLPQSRLYKCPPGCIKITGQETIGALIHPGSAKICISAWADRAIDTNGGVIQIQMTNAQESYKHHMWPMANGVTLTDGKSSMPVSFVVAKVDNPSMTSKRIRIINHDKIDVEGRLEIKIESVWTTIKPIIKAPYDSESNSQMMSKLAGSACKQLGQKGGQVSGSDPALLGNSFPQHEIQCHSSSDAFPCEIRADLGANGAAPPPVIPDHSLDVKIMCTKKDFSAAQVDPPGSVKMITPYAGATSDFPSVLNPDGKKVLMCMSVFQTADDQENKKNALVFCKSLGQPGIDSEFFSPVEVTSLFRDNNQLLYATGIAGVNAEKFIVGSTTLANTPCGYVVKIKCKGSPEPPVIKATAKDMGRAPGPKITTLTCTDSVKDLELNGILKGDPGSVFTFICPAGCEAGGTLIGAGLYAFKSPICQAAIHQFIISPAESNYVSVVVGQPKFLYIGRKNSNNMESEKFPASKEFDLKVQPITMSYAVIKTYACYILGAMPDQFFTQKKMGVRKNMRKRSDRITFSHQHTANQIEEDSLSLNSSDNSKNFKQNKEMFKNNLKSRMLFPLSFMQMHMKGSNITKYQQMWFAGATPDFYYAPMPNELRDLNLGKENESIDLGSEPGAFLTKDLGDGWTIIVGFNIEAYPSNQEYITIFSHSNNDCQEFVVKDLNLTERPPSMTFRVKGKEGVSASFNTLITPAPGKPNHVVLSQQKGKMFWFMNGKRQQVTQDQLDMSNFLPETCTSNLILGNNGGNQFMSGTVQQWALFREIWDIKIVKHFHDRVKTTILLPKGGGSAGGAVTIDGRACISPEFPAPPPPSASAPKKPQPTLEDKETQKIMMKSSSSEGESSLTNSSDAAIEGIAEDLAEKNPEMEEKLMDDPAEDVGSEYSACIVPAKSFYTEAGLTETEPGDFTQTGKKITCPEKCPEKAGLNLIVFGPEQGGDPKSRSVFGLESTICGAAIYAGVFEGATGGSVLIHLAKSRGPLLAGEESNGIKPKSGDAAATGVFQMSPSPPPFKLNCFDLATDTKIEKTDGKKAQVECPKGCYELYFKSKPKVIFGSMTNGQSQDSSICMAAMHAGLLSNDRKAILTIQVSQAPEEPREQVCKTSVRMDECEDVRGMGIGSGVKKYDSGFFFVDPVYSCKQYKDRPTTPVMQRYSVIENPDEAQVFEGHLMKPKNQSLELSRIINKNFDCGNASIEIAFSLAENSKKMGATVDEQFGVVFRHLTIGGVEEYQLLRFDREGTELQLVQKGARKTIIREPVNFDIVTGVATYDLKITYIADDIKVEIMKDPEMVQRTLFEIKDNNVHRGTVGFEKKGHIDVNVILFEVSDPRKKSPKEHILVEPQVKSIDLNMIESVCSTYKSAAISDERMHTICGTSIGFCARGCKKFKWYKNHHQNCLKKCHRKYDEWLKAKEAGTPELVFPCKDIMPGLKYEKQLKVDYKPVDNCNASAANPNEEQYPAWISEGEQIGEICMFKVKYICNQGIAPEVKEVKESDKLRFAKCGERIKARTEDHKCEEKVQEGKQFDELDKLKNRV